MGRGGGKQGAASWHQLDKKWRKEVLYRREGGRRKGEEKTKGGQKKENASLEVSKRLNPPQKSSGGKDCGGSRVVG